MERSLTVAVVALVVVIIHGAVLGLVVTARSPVQAPASQKVPVIHVFRWKENPPPPPLERPTPASTVPSPRAAKASPTPSPPSPIDLPPLPAAEVLPSPAGAPTPDASSDAPPVVVSTQEASVPPGLEYLPLTEVTLPPVIPAAELLRRIQYPDRARRLAIQGTVSLELFIDREGVIRRVDVLKDPGYGFAEAALNALDGLVCRPAELAGTPVAVRFRYPIRFTLK